MTTKSRPESWRSPMVILFGGCSVMLLALGIRASMGLFQKPMLADLGWGREVFAFALALQNLLWGVFQPLAGAAADKWGTGRVVAVGGVLYALGLFMMANTTSPLTFHLSAGVLLGLGQSGAGLSLILGVVGRITSPERQSWALGLVVTAGSFGQFVIVPLSQAFLGWYGWSTAFFLLGLCALLIVPLASIVRGRMGSVVQDGNPVDGGQTLRQAIVEAGHHNGFWLLTSGFFVCGFHVAFIGVHLPAYLTDMGMTAEVGAWSLALIGLFNIIGSYGSGVLGGKWSKKYLLSTLYVIRAGAILLFILLPLTPWTVLGFAAVMGLLWLSTVPLTSGLVVQIFGSRYMATLFGFVILSHQVGSFFGVWLGGYLFDTTGSYLPVWWAAIVLGILAALLHWPINESTVPRLAGARSLELKA